MFLPGQNWYMSALSCLALSLIGDRSTLRFGAGAIEEPESERCSAAACGPVQISAVAREIQEFFHAFSFVLERVVRYTFGGR